METELCADGMVNQSQFMIKSTTVNNNEQALKSNRTKLTNAETFRNVAL